MSKQNIDTYLVGQIMGSALVKYCNDNDIKFSDMIEDINKNEKLFIRGLKDSLELPSVVLFIQQGGVIMKDNKRHEINPRKSTTNYDSNDLYWDLSLEQREQM